ncbi:MAG: carbon starvation protein A [FCB group bacterium]|nr:carbon starvation protein A [FCB group bacterium]
MNVLFFLLAAIICYILAYIFYGRFVTKSVGVKPDRPTPATEINDGVDYVPTRPSVLFSHHYSTIAGAGPIIGPTLGILYGAGPAWFWIIVGAIFIGGVHDFTALFTSIREKGSSMAEVAKKSLGETGFVLFIIFTIILLVLVTSAFLTFTAISLTSLYPLSKLGLGANQTLLKTAVVHGQTVGIMGGIASTSVIVITCLAPLLGFLVTKTNIKTWLAFTLAGLICALSIYIGFHYPLSLSADVWLIIIAVYTFFASEAPVWVILQPRDFINVQILYFGMAAMVVGIIVAGFHGLTISAPLTNYAAGAAKMGPVWPFLFITISCGAISGFHSLVAGGTSSKQLAREGQAKAIAYGGMLLEGLLAILVVIAIGSSINFKEYMALTWPVSGKGDPILAFAISVGHLLHNSIGLSMAFGTVFGILMVQGFLITTLDSAVRLNRYLFEELWKSVIKNPPAYMLKFWFNSGLAVISMLVISWTNSYKHIWPLFGSANQLMAALALIAVSAWLYRAKKSNWFTLIPAVIMIVTTIAALIYKLFVEYIPHLNILLAVIDILLLILSIGVMKLSLKKLTTPKAPADSSLSA